MSKLKYTYIKAGEKISLKPDDVLISAGDIVWCAKLFEGRRNSAEMFASHLIALSHLVTRIVLSDRLVFTGRIDLETMENDKKDEIDTFLELVGKNCNGLILDGSHEVIVDSWPDGDLTELFPNIPLGEYLSAVKDYSPWITRHEGHIRGWLTELNMSEVLGIPFAPNPAISSSLGSHWARTSGSSEYLIRYLEDIRYENAKEAPELFHAMNNYDLQIPAIFSAVLRESKTPSDIFRVAAQMQREARPFRTWCRNLDNIKDPKIYTEKLREAQNSLDTLGRVLSSENRERMLVPVSTLGGLSPSLPLPKLRKWIDWMNVDTSFIRPRGFLLNLLSNARQISNLENEVSTTFSVQKDFSASAANRVLSIAKSQIK